MRRERIYTPMPKAEFIKTMFNDISGRYDLLNDVLSFGIHRLWKKKLVSKILSNKPNSFLDGATGTGDIALLCRESDPTLIIKAIDFSPNMIKNAKLRSFDVDFEVNDLMNLSLPDQYYDVSNVSFGIRNVEDYNKALKELARVTKKSIYIMEFGQPQNKLIKAIYFFIMLKVIPFIGKLFDKKEAYEYLIESSARFPSDNTFLNVIKENTPGFGSYKYTPLFFGVVYIYEAHKKD